MKVHTDNEPGTKLFLFAIHRSVGTCLLDRGLAYGGLL
jgi:hypothetical protein